MSNICMKCGQDLDGTVLHTCTGTWGKPLLTGKGSVENQGNFEQRIKALEELADKYMRPVVVAAAFVEHSERDDEIRELRVENAMLEKELAKYKKLVAQIEANCSIHVGQCVKKITLVDIEKLKRETIGVSGMKRKYRITVKPFEIYVDDGEDVLPELDDYDMNMTYEEVKTYCECGTEIPAVNEFGDPVGMCEKCDAEARKLEKAQPTSTPSSTTI